MHTSCDEYFYHGKLGKESYINLYKFRDRFLFMGRIGLDDFLKGDFILDDVRVVGVAGGSGSGKSYVAGRIADKIGARVLVVDDYIVPKEITKGGNWDLPKCWDLDLLNENLSDFSFGRSFEKPVYDFRTGKIGRYETFESGGVIVVEGLYALHNSIIEHIDFSIFVDSPKDVRLGRVVKRDFLDRSGYDEAKITQRWNESVQPTFLKHVESQKIGADLVLTN